MGLVVQADDLVEKTALGEMSILRAEVATKEIEAPLVEIRMGPYFQRPNASNIKTEATDLSLIEIQLEISTFAVIN